MEPDPFSWFPLFAILLFFSNLTAVEAAFATVNNTDIENWGEQKASRRTKLEELFNRSTQLFAAVYLLKKVCLVLAGGASGYLLFASTTFVQTLIVLALLWLGAIVGQTILRTQIARQPSSIVIKFAPFAQMVTTLVGPLAATLQKMNTRSSGLETDAADDFLRSEEGLRLLMNAGEMETTIEASEKAMITSILEMDETVAREVMVPRIDIVALDVEATIYEALDTIISAGHSRIPVYEDSIDNIIGLLYAKDLLKCVRDNITDATIRNFLRPAYFVPSSKKVDALLHEMKKQRIHIAMVVDEYGGTSGLITIEDIIEQIVGDIQDEYDLEEDSYVEAIDQSVYLLNSRLDLYSLSKLLDIEIATDAADTLGGLLYTLFEHVPEQGESVLYEGWRFTVLSLDGRRIESVRAEAYHTAEEPQESLPELLPHKAIIEGAL